ncbi:hypothetical protein BD769DRAFT_1714369 [Suillus cothurnatus]|nr:hypothetical protein BD769DRAFT_1714369 [Suillus cothurnatus]
MHSRPLCFLPLLSVYSFRMVDLSDLYVAVVSDDPSWFCFPEDHYASSLTDLPVSVVIEAACQLPSAFVPKKRTCAESVHFILLHFSRLHAELVAAPDELLFTRYLSYIEHPLPSVSRLCVISGYIEMLYGEVVAAALRRPYNDSLANPDHTSNLDPDQTSNLDTDHISTLDMDHISNLDPDTSNLDPDHTSNLDPDHIPDHTAKLELGELYNMSWALLPAKELVQRLEKLDRADIVKCIGNLPRSRRPGYARKTRRQCCAALVQHIQQRISRLQSLEDFTFLVNVLSIVPFAVPGTHEYLISLVLHREYSTLLVDRLEQPVLPLPERRKQERKKTKERVAAQTRLDIAETAARWPRVVPRGVVMDCLRDYVDGSRWQPGVVCAVCSRQVCSVNELRVDANCDLPLSLDILRLTDPFIVTKCVVQSLSSEFTYECSVLDGIMLDKTGITVCTSDSSTLNICGQCFRSLSRAKVPRFALANKLYRGQMPPQFRDLTWVEEMVCAIYRNMAHVTRLYQSSDPAQPFVFHGNTCAHETNLVSTAKVLP